MKRANARLMRPKIPQGRKMRNEGDRGRRNATVEMEPLTLCEPAVGGVMLEGVRVQVEFSGALVQERFTREEKLFWEVTNTVKLAVEPPVTLKAEGVIEMAKSG